VGQAEGPFALSNGTREKDIFVTAGELKVLYNQMGIKATRKAKLTCSQGKQPSQEKRQKMEH